MNISLKILSQFSSTNLLVFFRSDKIWNIAPVIIKLKEITINILPEESSRLLSSDISPMVLKKNNSAKTETKIKNNVKNKSQ